MSIRDKVLDTVKVQPQRCKEPGYLEAMQRCLKIKHEQAIADQHESVTFYLQVASAMNKPVQKRK